jgi:hypothetical protein
MDRAGTPDAPYMDKTSPDAAAAFGAASTGFG